MNKNQLYKSFNIIKQSKYEGVPGVIHIKSDTPGYCMGVTICTHGNEPCGLSIVEEVLSSNFKLKSGELFIVLNNLKATENYFNSSNEFEELNSRFIDTNMNRLSDNLSKVSKSYEEQRALELLEIWSKFDIAIDLHSTPQKSTPIIIEGRNSIDNFKCFIPSELVLTNMLDVQKGSPAMSFYGNKSSIVLGLEAGSHNDSSAQDISKKAVFQLCHFLIWLNLSYSNTIKKLIK